MHNLTSWALQIADASAKLPSGLLRGNLRVLGDLDACVTPASASAPVRGKYCLANIVLDADDPRWEPVLDAATSGRRGAEIIRDREFLSPSIFPTTARVEWGVCAPAACSPSDVEAALTAAARRLLAGTRLRVSSVYVPRHNCYTHLGSPRPVNAADYTFLIVIAVVIVLVVVGTYYDCYWSDYCNAAEVAGGSGRGRGGEDEGPWGAALRAFSLRANWGRLATGRPSGAVGCVDGVRAFSTMWVVLTHKVLQLAQEPWINKCRLFEAVEDFPKMPMVNSMLNVDTFFMMSGMLRSYNVIGALEEGRFSYTKSLLQRYLRLSPAYFIVVWFYATLFEYVGSGPAWQEYIGNNVKTCQESWIYNVLYINNYVTLDKLCVLQSWYLSADMQLFALAPLVLIPLWRFRGCGRAMMASLLALSVAVPAVIVGIWRLPGIYQLSNSDEQIYNYMQYVYSPTHTRTSSYIVGLALGYMLNQLKDQKFTLTRLQAALGWITSACVLLGIIFGPYHMMQPGHTYSLLENVAFGAMHRVLWALAVAWLVFACHMGYGGAVNRLLNCYALRGLSRLSYCVYLAHYIILLANSTRIRTPIWMDEFLLLHSYIGDFSISLILAVFLFLTFESPVFFLLKIVFPKERSKTSKADSEQKTTHIASDQPTATLDK